MSLSDYNQGKICYGGGEVMGTLGVCIEIMPHVGDTRQFPSIATLNTLLRNVFSHPVCIYIYMYLLQAGIRGGACIIKHFITSSLQYKLRYKLQHHPTLNSLNTRYAIWRLDKKSLQNKCNVCSTRTEKYLWTSKTFLQLYIYTRDRYVESHGHYRHVFRDRSSHLVDQRSTHFTLQQLTGTSGLHKKYE